MRRTAVPAILPRVALCVPNVCSRATSAPASWCQPPSLWQQIRRSRPTQSRSARRCRDRRGGLRRRPSHHPRQRMLRSQSVSTAASPCQIIWTGKMRSCRPGDEMRSAAGGALRTLGEDVTEETGICARTLQGEADHSSAQSLFVLRSHRAIAIRHCRSDQWRDKAHHRAPSNAGGQDPACWPMFWLANMPITCRSIA